MTDISIKKITVLVLCVVKKDPTFVFSIDIFIYFFIFFFVESCLKDVPHNLANISFRRFSLRNISQCKEKPLHLLVTNRVR